MAEGVKGVLKMQCCQCWRGKKGPEGERPLEVGKHKETDSSRQPPEGNTAQWDPRQTSVPHTSGNIFVLFKPLNFVIAVDSTHQSQESCRNEGERIYLKCSQNVGAFHRETEEKKKFTYPRTRVSKHCRRSEGGEESGRRWWVSGKLPEETWG